MATVNDVITYIGVPLAVLGVTPILYTSIKALFTLRSIQKSLQQNGLSHATTRGSPMSRTVEIEIPRCSITPLERSDPAYWKMNNSPSNLRGGSWTIFNWNRLITGQRLYRLQYSDDLREPQAEVGFEELLSFLLDRGAVPDVKGLHKLRTSGLWTPIGTNLLLSPDTTESVLRVALQDDSDGVLSLSLQWSPMWDRRGYMSLPPSWMRIEATGKPEVVKNDKSPGEETGEKNTCSTETLELLDHPAKQSIRFHLGHIGDITVINTAVFEKDHQPLDLTPNITHLQVPPTSTYFALAASALADPTQAGLSHSPISDTIRLLTKDSIPCGVLVLLGMLDEKDTPPWATQYNPHAVNNKRHSEFLAQQRKIAAERNMPPPQAQAARAARLVEERAAFHEGAVAEVMARKEREEKRVLEALNSPRLDHSAVVKRSLQTITEKEGLREGYTVPQAVEHVLYQMIIDESMAAQLSKMLDQWLDWTEKGGMNKDHLAFLKENTVVFCYVSCVVALVSEMFSKDDSGVGADLQECVRLYRKVRLG